MLQPLRLVLVTLLFLGLLPSAQAQGTAFTYQGRLDDANVPANGEFEIQFSLFYSPLAGDASGSVTQLVTVKQGLLTATLDFGQPALNGEPLWLELGVRANGATADFITLQPRQPLTSVPYAFRAATAQSAGTADLASVASVANSFTGSVSQEQLPPNLARVDSNHVFTGALTLTNSANVIGGNGARLTLLNASAISSGTLADNRLSTNVALRAGGNTFAGNQSVPNHSVAVSTLQNTSALNVGLRNGGPGWLSFYDLGDIGRWTIKEFNTGLNFAQPGIADGRLFLATNGNVGIGTLQPTNKLVVQGVVEATGGYRFPDGSVQTKAAVTPQIGASINMNFSLDDRANWTHVEDLADDKCLPSFPLGFTYTGFGVNTTVVSLSSNGILFLGANCSTSRFNEGLPTGISNDPMLFFFWDDLKDFGAGEYVEYITTGTAPGRVFNLYYRMRLFTADCGTAPLVVLISIHERSNLIKVSYMSISGCGSLRGDSATFGFQTAGGTSATAFQVGVNSPVLDDNSTNQSMAFYPPN